MKRYDIPLKMVPDNVSTCIVIHNLCITMKDGFNMDYIIKAKEQLQKRIYSDDLREGQKLYCEKASIQKVKNTIVNTDDFMVANKMNNKEIETFLLKENERLEDLFCEAPIIYKILAKSLWHYKI